MNKSVLCAFALATSSSAVFAQSSVTLYGVLDAGLTYASNVATSAGRGRVLSLSDGPPQANRWGLKGSEDLGGGLKAIFQLESGFNIATGASQQGSREFGRQAFMGLTSNNWGSFTMGRQYDPVAEFLGPLTANGTYGGAFFSHIFDNDNTDYNRRADNSVKFRSVAYSGVVVEGLYGFSNQPGAFDTNRTYSLAASYTNGAISFAGAYQQINNSGANSDGAISSSADSAFVSSRQRVFGFGGTYTVGSLKAGAMWSRTVYNDITSGAIIANYLRLDNFEVNARYNFTPSLYVGGGYTFTNGRESNGGGNSTSPKWHQVNLIVDYSLSKRTDVFALAAFQKAAGDATFASIYYAGTSPVSAPGTAKEFAARIGIRHTF